jgi:uncharacterized protein (TIGR00255 family)
MQSMTGYGRSEVQHEHLRLTIEARSVNHRYLDIAVRAPRLYAPLETRIKQLVGTYLTRGHIDITVAQQTGSSGERALVLDQTLAQQYYRALQQLQETLHLPGTIDLGLILSLRELLKVEEASEDLERVWACMAQGLEEALQALQRMRQQEGAVLCQDLQERVQQIARYVEAIRQRVPLVVVEYQQRLEQRVKELFQQFALEPERLSQEAILFAERTDIAEELTRLESHMQAFTRLLSETGAVGRKGEFLVQEMHREVNTIAAKSNDATISQYVIDIKSELERMREQIQNVE